jgi:hypothetical protein
VGRLDDIIERNKHPGRSRRAGMTIGIGLSLFVLIVLVMIVFTDFEMPRTEPPAPEEKGRVRGIELRVEPRRDAAAD